MVLTKWQKRLVGAPAILWNPSWPCGILSMRMQVWEERRCKTPHQLSMSDLTVRIKGSQTERRCWLAKESFWCLKLTGLLWTNRLYSGVTYWEPSRSVSKSKAKLKLKPQDWKTKKWKWREEKHVMYYSTLLFLSIYTSSFYTQIDTFHAMVTPSLHSCHWHGTVHSLAILWGLFSRSAGRCSSWLHLFNQLLNGNWLLFWSREEHANQRATAYLETIRELADWQTLPFPPSVPPFRPPQPEPTHGNTLLVLLLVWWLAAAALIKWRRTR